METLSKPQRELIEFVMETDPLGCFRGPEIFFEGRVVSAATQTLAALQKRGWIELVPELAGYSMTPCYRLTVRALHFYRVGMSVQSIAEDATASEVAPVASE